jgi:hypothetical protein
VWSTRRRPTWRSPLAPRVQGRHAARLAAEQDPRGAAERPCRLCHGSKNASHLITGKDGNGAVSGRISAGFRSSGFGFGLEFLPTVFGFGSMKLIGFGFGSGFSPVDIQWITEISHYELKFMFYYILIILLLIYYFKLSHEIIYYFVASYLYM